MIPVVAVILAQLVPTACRAAPSQSVARLQTQNPRKSYTVQILSVSAERRPVLLAAFESLKEKGYLAYYCRKRIGGRQYLRLRTGVFGNPSEARAYAEEFRRKEGFDYFIAEADGSVDYFRNRFCVFTTPSGIWLKSGTRVRELYKPAHGEIDTEHTAARISPNGLAVVFYESQRIVKVEISTGEARTLRQAAHEDELLNSIVRWSPDARYIAYLDAVEWERPTKLWIMRSDGTDNRCLVADDTSKIRVKSFLWHPRRNRLFYVAGPTHGTVSVGGSLWCAELDGTRRRIVAAGLAERTEVCSEFAITDKTLCYRVAHFDVDGQVHEYTHHRLSVDELD